jgi:glucose-6-phosphate 1-dehydrogenase
MKTRKPEDTILVIFGAGGDLSWRKLIPAICDICVDEALPEHFAIIGIDRKEMSKDEFSKHLRQGINRFSKCGKMNSEEWKTFQGRLAGYMVEDFSDPETYSRLSKRLSEMDNEWGKRANHVFYMATPPSVVQIIVPQLGKAELVRDREKDRIVVEKPFGHDLESAKALNKLLTSVFTESQIYRIDHYLGKETVQNILAFRFANALFEPIWGREYIDHVQITVAESVGVEHRGEYYDHAGALRDMIQNHLLQILSLIAMEPTVSFDADEIRNKKVDVLHAIRPFTPDQVHQLAARGQYMEGWLEGDHVKGYRDEPNVDPESNSETFAALKLFIDNWRWQGVPFYLRTGKRMPLKVSEACIEFRPVPHQSFPSTALSDWQPNRLVIRIQPEEGISLRFQAKRPGLTVLLSPVDMVFTYQEAFKTSSPEAYETLLLDVMIGDATLFMRADQIEAAWSIITPVLEAWEGQIPTDFPNYQAGMWGPEEADILIAQDGRSWVNEGTLQEDGN